MNALKLKFARGVTVFALFAAAGVISLTGCSENEGPLDPGIPAGDESPGIVGAPDVQGELPGGPNTPVSDTGESTPILATGTPGMASFEGSGTLAPGGGMHLTESEVAALASLPARTAGEVSPLTSIIGADSRVRITPTTSFPARAVALVTMDGGRCTGWMIGSNTVATAGHCVHSGGSGGAWSTNVRVYPGYDGTYAPYGSCTYRRLYSVTGWTGSGNEEYDYGAIKLNCSVGSSTGWFGMWWQTASLTGTSTRISGYPGDKPLTQWRSLDNVDATGTRQVFYQNDTTPGMSGSPVYQYRSSSAPYCTGYCAMAVHAYGLHASGSHAVYNHGTRITEGVFNNFMAWRAAS